MLYDLIAIDLDGTLLNSAHQLSAENRAALHRAHEAGLRIVLCTGRAFTETRSVLEMIGLDLDATVTVFGALVTDVATEQTIDRTYIPAETAADVVAWFQRDGYPVLWLTDANDAGHDGYVIDGPNRHIAVDQWVARTPCVVHAVEAAPPDACPPLRLSIIHDEGTLDDVSARLRTAFDGRLVHNVLHAPPYRLSLIESFAPQVNKWYGIGKLLERWQIDPARTAAIGDDVNDIAMLRHAGLGVAVANARPAVRDAADRVTVSNDEHAVAGVIAEVLAS